MVFFNSFFSKNRGDVTPVDLSIFKVDMHSHLIPNIDDGSKSIDETINLLLKFESMGYRKIITTPHIMSDHYPNTKEVILKGLSDVRRELSKLNLDIILEAAAEYYFDYELMKNVINKEKLLVFGDNYLLVEFPFHSKPNEIETLFFQLLLQGYKPVIAHFERYLYFNDFVYLAREWREKGIFIQLNFSSIFNFYGSEVRYRAEKLIDSEQVDFAASDCHNVENLILLESNRSKDYLYKLSCIDLRNSDLI